MAGNLMPVAPTTFDGSLLYTIGAAAAQHPASAPPPKRSSSKPVRNAAWDQVRLQTPVPTRQTTHKQVSLPKPPPKPPVRQTQTSVSGHMAPVPVARWTTSPALQSQPQTTNSVWDSMTGWLGRKVSGAYESVRYNLPFVSGRNDGFLSGKQSRALSIARQEFYAGVREKGSTNTGKRVDVYAKASKMRTGQEWCGFFVGYAYSQNGFKKPEMMASGYKAQLFYLYRTMSGKDQDMASHRAHGQTRQYFVLPESPSRSYLKGNASQFPHYDLNANTFNWNTLPVRTGDTILFERGNPTGIPDHVGMVESYDRATGRLVTIEGNVDNKVVRKTYDLRNASVRRTISGFGRPAPGDFV
jgi:hypothetical protein